MKGCSWSIECIEFPLTTAIAFRQIRDFQAWICGGGRGASSCPEGFLEEAVQNCDSRARTEGSSGNNNPCIIRRAGCFPMGRGGTVEGSQASKTLKGLHPQGSLAAPFIQVLVQILHPQRCRLWAPRLMQRLIHLYLIAPLGLFPW